MKYKNKKQVIILGFLFVLSLFSLMNFTVANWRYNQTVSESDSYDFFSFALTGIDTANAETNWSHSGNVNNYDNSFDFYEMYETSNTSKAGITWSSSTEVLNILLFDSFGDLVAFNITNSSPSNVSYNVATAGKYYPLVIYDGISTTSGNSENYDLWTTSHLSTSTHGPFIDYDDEYISSGDEEYYKFTANFTGTARFLVLWDDSDESIDISAHDSLGVLITSDTSTNPYAYVEISIITGEIYYLKVTNLETSSNDLVVLGNVLFDHSTTIPTPKKIISGSVNSYDDSFDFYEISATAGSCKGGITWSSSTEVLNLLLFDSSGDLVDSDITSNSPNNVSYNVATAGKYYPLVIYDGISTTFGNSENYDLWTTSYLSTSTHGPFIDYDDESILSRDEEYYKFTASFTGTARFLVLWDDSDENIDISAHDSLGVLITSDTSTNPYAYVEINITTGQIYYLKVTNLEASSNDLVVLGNVAFDYSLTIPIPKMMCGSVNSYANSFDFYEVSATAGSCKAGITWSSSTVVLNLLLFDSSGDLVDSDITSNSPNNVSYSVITAGKYYPIVIYDGISTTSGTSENYEIRTSSYLSSSTHGPFEYYDDEAILSGDEEYYKITASFTGTARFLVLWDDTEKNIDISAHDSNGFSIIADTSTDPYAYVEISITTGQIYYLKVTNLGASSNELLVLSNVPFDYSTTIPNPWIWVIIICSIIFFVFFSIAGLTYAVSKSRRKGALSEETGVIAPFLDEIEEFPGEEKYIEKISTADIADKWMEIGVKTQKEKDLEFMAGKFYFGD